MSSEETVGEDAAAANAIDGDLSTFWHTQWKDAQPVPPYTIDLDLGELTKVCALTYYPRQNSANGQIADYEVYVSTNGESWGEPVSAGSLEAGGQARWIPFEVSEARYIRLIALREIEDRSFVSAAELTVDVIKPSVEPTVTPTVTPTITPTVTRTVTPTVTRSVKPTAKPKPGLPKTGGEGSMA